MSVIMSTETFDVAKQIHVLESSLQDMNLTMQEADQAVATLESKINSRRTKNPLEPIPFELFSDFCRDWIEKCKVATETVRFQLRKANGEQEVKRELVEEKQKMAGSDSIVVDHESLIIQKKDHDANLLQVTRTNYDLMLMGGEVKRDTSREKIKLAETMQQYGQISADYVKLEKNLGALEHKIERTEQEIRELEAINEALREKTGRYKAPTILEIAQKIGDLERAEKELVDVVKGKLTEFD